MAEDPQKKEILAPPKMTILSDHPILREEDGKIELDSFTLSSRLGAVYDIIRHKNTRPPLAVAIYGDWGTGKSSAMRWLSDALEQWSEQDEDERKGHARIRTVWFDPWKYTKREDVWRGLISEVIIRAITVRGATLQTVTKAAGEFSFFLGRSFLNALSGLKLKVGGKADAIAAGAKADATVDFAMLTKIAEDYKQTNHPEKAYLNEFETALREWVKAQLGKDERMVLFIDDLDRCLPGVVLEVLEALKLYLNIPQLIFVVGLDRDVVESVVEKHYAEQGLGKAKAKHYLDKMFQVEVEIPPSQKLMGDYIKRQINRLDEECKGYWSENLTGWKTGYKAIIEEKITDLAAHNPREVKRLLNSTLLRATAAARDGTLGGDESIRFTQGCQVYLIHSYLKKYVPKSGGLLREERILEFLETWSDFIRAYGVLSVTEDRQNGETTVSEGRSGFPEFAPEWGAHLTESDDPAGEEHEVEHDKAEAAYAALKASCPHYRDAEREPIPLLGLPDLWDLLFIPFSEAVAAAAVSEADAGLEPGNEATRSEVREHKPADEIRTHAEDGIAPMYMPTASVEPDLRTVLVDMSPALRSAIARALDKSIDSLTAGDLRNLSELNMRESSLGIGDFRHIAALPALRVLSLARTDFTDEGLELLGSLRALKRLYLWQTRIGDEGLSHLAGLEELEVLHLGLCRAITDSGLRHIKGLVNLRELNLQGTQITDSGLEFLGSLRKLEDLDMSNTGVTNMGLQHIDGCKRLVILYAGNTRITAEAKMRFLATRKRE